MPLSMNTIRHRLKDEDLLLEGRATIPVFISIERAHRYIPYVEGKMMLALEPGYFVTLGFPFVESTGSEMLSLAEEKRWMVAPLLCMGNEERYLDPLEVLRFLKIDGDLPMWTVSTAP